jgi:hypothetical protein
MRLPCIVVNVDHRKVSYGVTMRLVVGPFRSKRDIDEQITPFHVLL